MQPELTTDQETGLMATARTIAHRLHLPTTFVKFLIVGGIGFLINQFIFFLTYDSPIFWFFPDKDTRTDLGLFTHPNIRLLISSIIAVEVAIVTQFNLHERWTFRWRPRGGLWILRFLKFNLSSIVSPIIVVVTVNVLTPVFGISPYIAIGIGVLLGFMWNWTINSLIIWPALRRARGKDDAEYHLATAEAEGQDRPTS
jgi:putative flippase GtrA